MQRKYWQLNFSFMVCVMKIWRYLHILWPSILKYLAEQIIYFLTNIDRIITLIHRKTGYTLIFSFMCNNFIWLKAPDSLKI